jgi:hypothetical protein
VRRMCVARFGSTATLVLVLLFSRFAMAQSKNLQGEKDGAQCKFSFSVVTEDTLKNITQGLPQKDAEWFEKKIQNKYPDVCYVAPNPDVPLVFFILVTPDVYHGTHVVTSTNTQESPVSGTITDENGNTSTLSGTETTTTQSSTAFHTP